MSAASNASGDVASVCLSELRIENFAPRVGDPFRIADADREFDLRLESVDSLGAAPPGLSRAPFSLVFSASATPVLSQGQYALDHAELGRLELFLVPISSADPLSRYEAVFA